MTIQTFVPPRKPDVGAMIESEVKLLKAEFGDNYTQVAADGINHIREKARLTWTNITVAEAKAIIDFMRARGGHEPFYYQIADGEPTRRWRCEQFPRRLGSEDIRDVTIELVQDFGLSQ